MKIVFENKLPLYRRTYYGAAFHAINQSKPSWIISSLFCPLTNILNDVVTGVAKSS